MIQLKRIGYIFVALLGVASAVVSKSKVENPQAVSTDGLTPADSALLSPSPSTEFSTRLGVREEKTEGQDSFKPSVNFLERRKNSSVSASSKSPQISYPDSGEDKSVNNEDSPNSLVLKLLDDKDSSESPASPKESNEEVYDGRARFPKIYYGEVSPPYSAHDHGAGDESGSRDLPEKVQEEEPKYYYPKNYINKQSGNKKKRFEYKHDEQRHSPEHHQGPRHQGSHELSQSPEKLDHQHEPDHHHGSHHGHERHPDHGQEGHQEHGLGYGHDLGHHGHDQGYGYSDHGHHDHQGHQYRHGHGIDVIGKALKVLIPSALLLTGVSALFPNRQYVPTNDRGINYNYNDHHRHKRSIEYSGDSNYNGRMSPSSEMLEREHRSMDIGIDQSYEYDGLGNNARFGEFSGEPVPSMYEQIQNNDFDILPNSNEQMYSTGKSNSYGQKVILPKQSDLPFLRRPSTPQEYDQYHYGHPQLSSNEFSSPVSSYEPASPSVMPTISTQDVSKSDIQDQSILESAPTPSAEPPKKRRRVRVRSGIRKKMIRSRPLPTSTKPAGIPIQEFHPMPESQKFYEPRHINHSNKLALKENQKSGNLVSPIPTIAKPVNPYLKGLDHNTEAKQIDLSPDAPVMGLITSYAQHDSDSPACQKRALCELALKGKQPTATKFESFLWSLATLVPDQFSKVYELEDIFKAIKTGHCREFACVKPNLDIQG